jgi:hypothetical protein
MNLFNAGISDPRENHLFCKQGSPAVFPAKMQFVAGSQANGWSAVTAVTDLEER